MTAAKLRTNFKKAEDSPGFLLWKAANVLQHLHARCLSDLNVTPTQFSLMTCLVYLFQAGPVTASQISAHSGIDKMTVSDLVKTLAKKRMLRTRRHPTDGRALLLEPTAEGIRATNSAVRRVEAVDARFFGRLKDAERLRHDLSALIDEA